MQRKLSYLLDGVDGPSFLVFLLVVVVGCGLVLLAESLLGGV